MSDETKQDAGTNVELAKLAEREAAARARIEAIEAKRLVRERERVVLEREREAEEAEVLEQMRAEHGEIGQMIAYTRTARGVVVVKRAPGVVYNRFENSKMNQQDRERFVSSCRVHPDAETYARIVDEQPAVVMTLADKLIELYGFKRKEDAGK